MNFDQKALISMRESKKIARDVGWVFTSSIISMIFTFLVSVIIGRWLGPTSLGLYQLTMSIFFLIMVFAGIGVPAATTKFIAEYKITEEGNQIATASFLLSFTVGILVAVVVFLLSKPIASFLDIPSLIPFLQIIALAFPLRLANLIQQAYLNGLRLMKWLAASLILESSLMFIFTFIMVWRGFGALGAVLGFIAALAVNCFFLAFVVKFWHFFTLKSLRKACGQLLSFGVQIAATGVINEINYQTSTLALGYFTSEEEVGFYSVTVTLSRFFTNISNAIQRVTYPATSEFWKEQKYRELSLLLQRTVRYTASLFFFTGICVIIFAKEIVVGIYGKNFEPSVLAFQLIIVGVIFSSALSRPLAGTITAIGRPDIGVKVAPIAAFVNIALALLFIPTMGINGAAIAALMSFSFRGFLGLFLNFYYTKTKIEYFWLFKSISISALALFAYYIARIWLTNIIAGIFVIIVYLIIVLFVFLTQNDRKFFLGLLKEGWQRIWHNNV
ncbi:MAG: flippase [Candidatus Heimdallarchaeota archaeon]